MAILTQTGGASAAGDLTYAIGNSRLSVLCPNSAGNVSTATVAAVIADAEAEVLSILGPGFNVESGSTKAVVKAHTKQVAIYRCYCRVTEFRNERGEPVVKPDYIEAVAALKEIAAGQRDMGDETTTGKTATVSGVVNYSTKAFIVETAEGTTGPVGGF
jgi:phage gp36-like protein